MRREIAGDILSSISNEKANWWKLRKTAQHIYAMALAYNVAAKHFDMSAHMMK